MTALVLAILLLVGLIILLRVVRPLLFRGSRPRQQNRFTSPGQANQFLEKVPHHLKQRLTNMAGNANVAQRLVQSLQVKYPGKPAAWYWEKAIFDLERDRRY